MSGSKKGRKLRPYRTGPITPMHVLLRTPEQRAADEWEYGATTAEMLDWPIDLCTPVGLSPTETEQ